jgi:hypothetical protein
MAATTENATVPAFPPGRYGRRREPGRRRRWVPALVVASAVLVGLAVAMLLYDRHGDPVYRPTVESFQLADDHASIRFRVHKPATGTAVCRVRARDRAGAEIAGADVPVPAGGDAVVEYTLATPSRAWAVDVPSCSAPR